MKKIQFTTFIMLITNVLPFVGNLDLLAHWKMIIILICCALIWLTQPPMTFTEAEKFKTQDRYSVLLILAMGSISIIATEINWAFFSKNTEGVALWNIVGLTMLISGLALRIWAIQTLGLSFTATVQIVDNQQLISKGAYRYVRHPSYLGAYIAIVGSTVFMQAWVSFAITAVGMLLVYMYRIAVEERTLLKAFGQGYLQYQRGTFRLLPFVW